MTFGLVIPEYTMKDYIFHAIEAPNGYETLDIWGRQGSMKSNRTLQIAYWVYGDWDIAIKEMVLMPNASSIPGYEDRGFLQKMQSIQKGEAIPLVSWDDLTVSMPSSTFKTDIEIYGAIDAAWAALRTKVKVVVLNNPLIDRIGKNIKDNITLEVMIGPNQVEQIERWIRLVGLKQENSNFFKVQVEPLHRFDWKAVPKDVFKEYHNIRLEIADYAIHKLGEAMKDEASIQEDMIPMDEMWKTTPVSLTTLNDMIKRGFIAHEKINGKIYVHKDKWQSFVDFENSRVKNRKGKNQVP